MQPVARLLGGLLAESLQRLSPSAPRQMVVIPVPMYAAKQRQRGFNHAELIARSHRGDAPPRPAVEPSSAAQHATTCANYGESGRPDDRQAPENLRGAFFVPEPSSLKGKHVLLVDDIYTTGATARACSQVLLRAGAASVTSDSSPGATRGSRKLGHGILQAAS